MKRAKMRRTDRELTLKDEIVDVLKEGEIIQIAFIDGNEPYIVTLNYGYTLNGDKTRIYLHSANEGRKINCIRNNPHVCFEISISDSLVRGEEACNYGMRYRSVLGYGEMKIVENNDEKVLGLNLLMKQYTEKDNWIYNQNMLEKTVVICLEVNKISGKRKM
jgi:nitroimidazol reductase NimA-like FMN-containing flavoprotein (pyridoxamine 5'-phosphate oxidase superfamily)